MVCCCCRNASDDGASSDNAAWISSRDAQGAPPKANAMMDRDDDADKEAVQWLRSRSSKKDRSELPSTQEEDEIVADESDQQQQEQQQVKSIPPSTSPKKRGTSSAGPVDTDEYLDSTVDKKDSNDSDVGTSLRKDSQLEVVAEGKEGAPAAADEERLSFTASSVDAVSRVKYAEACRLLKKMLLEKEETLTKAEQQFLDGLVTSLDSADSNLDKLGSDFVVDFDQLSDVESAVHVLETDPLFQEDAMQTPLPPWPAKSMPKKKLSPPPQDLVRTPIQRTRSNTAREKGVELTDTDVKETNRLVDGGGDKWWAFEDGGGADVPHLAHDDEDEKVSKRPKTDMEEEEVVRFDGWTVNGAESGPFLILGTSVNDKTIKPNVLSPLLMEALRGFFPFVVSEENFWLKFSLVRDGASLETLINSVRASVWTIIAIETMEGFVFGSFTGTPWRKRDDWFGSGEAFLWRLKKSRMASPEKIKKHANFDSEMEVYPYTRADDLVQYCSSRGMLAVGGGDWVGQESPHKGEPLGIGLMVDGDLAGGETNSCATFANPRLCRPKASSNEFQISNLEVWTLTPCVTVEEAEKMELRKLFIEEHQNKNGQ